MDIGDSGEFSRRLNALAEIWDLKLAATRKALYFEALRDLPFEAVAHALNQAAKTCTFFPKPAELRALAIGDAEDRVEAAWMAFRAALGKVGAYSSLATTDPALGEAIVAVFQGWPQACALELSPEMWAAKRKEFGRVYRVFQHRQLVGPRYLPGICEQQNAGKLDWQRYNPVAVIDGGDVRKLKDGEAAAFRELLAGQSGGFSQIQGSLERLLPAQPGETA